MTKWMKKEEYKINLLYAFPSYRGLLRELEDQEKIIKRLKKIIEGYKKTNKDYDFLIKQKNRIIYKLRKEKKNEN